MLIPGSYSLRQSAATAMLLRSSNNSCFTHRSSSVSTLLPLPSVSYCTRTSTTTALHLAFSTSTSTDGLSSLVSSVFSVTNSYQDTTKTLGILAAYSLVANLLYLARRANLRQMTIRELWKIRTTREEGVSRPLFAGMLMAWQMLVLVFPIVEPCVRFGSSFQELLFGSNTRNPKQPSNPKNSNRPGWTIFFYSYPKAQGGGYILEPLACQHLGSNQRARQQIRFDWHSFKYNTGPLGRDGFRHPPTIERNLPHIDIPRYQMKHWPWRRCYKIPDDEED
ncbi:unnamed protein product [Cylindrotheca closterium]|uniref:Uncharacterized protein n=1 Tax=Cylindrotheca closterium TaxID=2856 RepID=A0AAD2CMP3_9STRA|nr:unnamed protein product [Cylindrotheca closterium]